MHIVFVALDPIRHVKRVVGIYAAAKVDYYPIRKTKTDRKIRAFWAEARTKLAVWVPIDRRPKVASWEKGQGQRRWASLPLGKSYPALRKQFEQLRNNIVRLIRNPPLRESEDQTYSGLAAREGEQWKIVTKHRSREARLRKAKINSAMAANRGRLVCEVPGCRFDFFARYGEIGRGYAQVHHRKPLSNAGVRGQKTTLEDLAIVCANCHSMIHAGGECRGMKTLIPRKRK